ncbi:MAG: co-chaperone DjlA [Methylophilaceae bacterium]
MFKIIIGIAGFYYFGFFGALIGYFVGGSIDRARNYGVGGVNPLRAEQRRTVFLETVFVLMGKLAKADGIITKDEIDHAEQVIQEMRLTEEHREQAISQFKRGSAADFDTTETLNTFMLVCGQTLNLRQVLLTYLIVMALADGKLDSAEQTLLKSIAVRLGYSQSAFQQMLDMVLNQAHFAAGQPASSTALADAYKALGAKENQTDQEIKRAYRKLMSQYHPDKLIGQGLPEDMIAVATEKAKEIQLAYDLIKQQRKI